MANNQQNRRGLAAAVQSYAPLIVAFNLRHFPAGAPGAVGCPAQSFLVEIFRHEAQVLFARLEQRTNPRAASAEIVFYSGEDCGAPFR